MLQKDVVAQRKDNLLGSTTLPANDMSTLPTQWSGRQRVAFDYSISLSVFSLHKCGEAIKRKYRWLKLMITTFLRCQLRYVNCNANTSLDLYQNENDKEAESLEGLQLYLRNATRVWNVIWKVTFVQKFARDSRDPHLQQSWFFSLLAILGFSRIYKRKPCGECPFIIFLSNTEITFFQSTPYVHPFNSDMKNCGKENQARKRGWIEGGY